MRYVYGITAALLLGGTAATLTVGPVGAQTAQNDPGAIARTTPRPGAPMSFADLAARLQPAVVNISTKQSIEVNRSPFPPGFEEFFRRFGGQVPEGGEDNTITQRGGSLGSGFIVSADGYIVTNNHVIAPARDGATVDEITVTLADRKEYEAELVGRDVASDLAVLKIDAQNLPFVRFGDSTQTRVGDWVVAIGNPFGLGGTVTAGIVSALHRGITGGGAYDRYIQTDASINQGNSGGPMFDVNGNVIGINTALISPTGGNVGIGFAIPAEQARPVIEALRRGERPERGYIGVSLQPLDEGIADSLGIPRNRGELIRGVQPGSPASRAGIEQGDVIITVAGEPVTPDQTLSYLVAQQPVGSRIPIELIRDGQRRTVNLVIAERPTEEELAELGGGGEETEIQPQPEEQQTESQRQARESLGVTVQTLTPAVARQLRLSDANIRGDVIAAVDPSSDAAAEGLRAVDINLSINPRPTPTPEAAPAAVEAARQTNRGSVLLLIRRGNNPPLYIGVDLVRG